ncbi:MAG: 23S rRNA (adenine(2503)-C(2))-methyltransferase RlmN [Nitrospirae bacterium]|nr:23S rRNA (adenine(2503)-C(2))-methyltransferase RlmN [Nitrospirota bacterium]
MKTNSESSRTDLKALSEKEMIGFIGGIGLKPYRARQILHWMYRKRVTSFEEMTDLPKSSRRLLEETAFLSNLKLLKRQVSIDGTEKFLFGLDNGKRIECVLIPDEERLTLCVSSQVGCALGCKFCLTGKLGLKRNLKALEIVDQVISVQRLIEPRKITNIVFMGMGEPLANFDEVVEALKRLVTMLGFSRRKITLSTCGIPTKILQLPEKAPAVNLAVSLNATTDKIRDSIMPINRIYPIKKLLDACRNFPLQPGRIITFEYVLIDNINDTVEDAIRLAKLLKGMRCKINLIPFNPVPDCVSGRRPSDEKVLNFQKILIDKNMTVIIRKSKGADIGAACGQLEASYIKGQRHD